MPAQAPTHGGEAPCRFGLELFNDSDDIALHHLAAVLRVRARAEAINGRPHSVE